MTSEGLSFPHSKESKKQRIKELEDQIAILTNKSDNREIDWKNPYALDNEILTLTVELENLKHQPDIEEDNSQLAA